MQTSPYFSFPQQWTAQDLADAVPLRLHEMFEFDATRQGIDAASANTTTRTPLRRSYLRAGEMPRLFCVR